jgi:hypothetical protein
MSSKSHSSTSEIDDKYTELGGAKGILGNAYMP